jgi:uncharacterized Zn finger protein
MSSEQSTHPVIEKAARAASDWITESDWECQVDRARRVINVLVDELSKEGYEEASNYLKELLVNKQNVFDKDNKSFSKLYF